MNNTNFSDFLVVVAYLTFLLAGMGGTAYLVQVYNWSPWWFMFSTLLFGSVSLKTGGKV